MELTTWVIVSLIITELVLTYRIWKLERQMKKVIPNFKNIDEYFSIFTAKVGIIEDFMRDVVTGKIKVKSEKFGELVLWKQ